MTVIDAIRPGERTAPLARSSVSSWGAIYLTIALGGMALLGVDSWIRAVAALTFVLWVPGSAMAVWMRELTPAEARGVSVTLSLAVGLLVPSFALWAHWWHPGALFAVVAVGSVASHTLALRCAPPMARQRFDAVSLGVAAPFAVAAFAAAMALVQLSRHDHVVGNWGLVPQLPVAWFVAVTALAIGAAMAWRRGSSVALAATALITVVLLHATAAAAYSVPRFPWAYKHVGVTAHLLAHGHLSSGVDIYNNWPGFFGFTGFLFKVGGINDVAGLVRWWPLVIELATIVVLRFFFGALTDDRRIWWGAVTVAVLANWVGQDYFAPQSLAFVVAFGTFGLLLRTNAVPERLVFAVERRQRAIYAAAGLCAFAAITVTHQISPYLMLPGIVIGCVIGGIRPRWLAGACVALALAYLVPRYGWVRTHGGIGHSSLGDNVRTPSAGLVGAAWSVTVSNWSARLLTVGVAVAGLPYIVRFRRDRWWTLFLLSNLVGPACVLFVNAYGNEAVLRTTLFALPWMSFSVAASFGAAPTRRSLIRRAAVWGSVVGIAAVLFALSTWAIDARYRVGPEEVAVVHTFETTAPAHAMLVQLGPSHLPVRMTSRYPEFEYRAVLPFADAADVSGALHRLETAAAPVAQRRAVYLSSTASADRFASVFGYGRPSDYAALREALRRSSRWTIVLDDGQTLLARYRLQTRT